jgi:hypothetical protein
MNNRYSFFILALFILLTDLSGQNYGVGDEVIQDKIYSESIKSVQFYRAGWELTYPVIGLMSEDQVCLSFDELTGEVKDLSYTLIHCDAGWRPSSISKEEYMDGFQTNQIHDYSLSFNTYFNYIHYTLVMPNEDVRFRISGNYILKIYKDFNEEHVIMTKRFAVAESVVSIKAEVKRPVIQPFMDTGHEVSFSVLYGNLPVLDPYSEIQVTVCQNNRWNLAITGLKPLFYKDGILEYTDHHNNIFPGGNEYRNFDIKSLRYQTEFVKNIEYIPPYYHIELFPDKSRAGKVYFYNEDINGRYFIDIQEGKDKDTEADYVYVHFTLAYDAPVQDGRVYVFGALTNWTVDESNMMEYNFERKAYELTMLLKQGYYNYEYVFVADGSPVIDAFYFESSHYEAENDYLIYVYYRTNNSRYDRLVGYQIVNSLSK